MFIRLCYSAICVFDMLKCTCLSVCRYIEPEACVCVCACVRECVSCFLLFVSEGHNANKIIMYVYYLIKCMHVCLMVPPSINEAILLVSLLLLIR